MAERYQGKRLIKNQKRQWPQWPQKPKREQAPPKKAAEAPPPVEPPVREPIPPKVERPVREPTPPKAERPVRKPTPPRAERPVREPVPPREWHKPQWLERLLQWLKEPKLPTLPKLPKFKLPQLPEVKRPAVPQRAKPKHQSEREYNPWIWLGAIFLGPLAILLCVQLITLGNPIKAAAWLFGSLSAFGAAVLTYLALLFMMILLTALIWKVWLCFFLLAVPAVILAVINRLKESVNGAPLVLSDFGLAKDADAIAGFIPKLNISIWIWLGLGIAVVALLGSGRLGWRPKSLTPRWVLRRNVALIAAGALAATLILPYGFYVGGVDESQAERNHRLGLMGGLYSAVLNQGRGPSVEYDPDQLKELLSQISDPPAVSAQPTPEPEGSAMPAPTPEPVTPNVIMFMSESFCDPSVMLPGVQFSADPVPNYHDLARTTPSGDFISNTYAGGTGNVEMEVFTGIPSAFVGEGEELTSLKTEGVYDRLPSIVKTFRSAGYDTQFVHNYTTRLYNRVENLPAIGFDEMTFQGDFPQDAEWNGPYLTDVELAKQIIRTFEDRDKDQPIFLYGLTMENHQPFYTDKFPQPSGLEPESDKLGGDALGVVDALVQGLHGADEALGILIDYFDHCGEPVLFVFWGDHLPGLYLDDEHTVYSMLDYVPTADTLQWDSQVMKQMHTTPFFVWNNYGAELDIPEVVSANNLGSLTLGWAGLEKPLYFRWLDQAQETVLLYRKRLYVAADGTPYREPPKMDRVVVEQFRSIAYDLLYGDGVITEEMTAVGGER